MEISRASETPGFSTPVDLDITRPRFASGQAVQQRGDHGGGRPNVVPHRPPAQVALPHVTGAGVRSGHRGQPVVQGDVAECGDEKRAHEVEDRPSQEAAATRRADSAKSPASRRHLPSDCEPMPLID